MWIAQLALVAALVVGCGATETVDPTVTCVEQEFRAELHVDAHDPRMVWATQYETGRNVAVRPRPPGFFTFDAGRPTTLLDRSGEVLSFAGEILRTGCFDAASQSVYIGSADVPEPNRVPN